MIATRPEDYSMEMGPMGPIGEHASLILRVNRNCPWNRCRFCPVYKGKKFSSRTASEIRADIDSVCRIRDLIENTSWQMGCNGRVNNEVIREVITKNPEIYGEYPEKVDEGQWVALQSLKNVATWMYQGAARIFLQDADALAMQPGQLSEVLVYLGKAFPHLERVSVYARAKTVSRRTPDVLGELKDAGLGSCYVGIESGCNEVLEYMDKGVSSHGHIEAGKKLKDAGISLAAFVMPGLAGGEKKKGHKHMNDTIHVLNEIQPDEVRVRSLAVLTWTPLYEQVKTGSFHAPSEDQMVEELGMLIEGLSFNCTFETLQLTNLLFHVRCDLFQNRDAMLGRIHHYLGLPPLEKARFLLESYKTKGYLDCVKSCGAYDSELESLIVRAEDKIVRRATDALAHAEQAAFAIKSKVIP
ncbi:MAG TPA: radical SAM protein [Deltaproteobacteria bacterium]|nr:radical SAM protein [Deltaproteobacteria bacterium]